MLITLNTSYNKIRKEHSFKSKESFKDFLVNLNSETNEEFWWVFEHDLPNLQVGKKESSIYNSLKTILDLWSQNKIPASNPNTNFWELYLTGFKTEESAIKFKQSFDNDPY